MIECRVEEIPASRRLALPEDGRRDECFNRLREGLIEIPTRGRMKPIPVFAPRESRPVEIPA